MKNTKASETETIDTKDETNKKCKLPWPLKLIAGAAIVASVLIPILIALIFGWFEEYNESVGVVAMCCMVVLALCFMICATILLLNHNKEKPTDEKTIQELVAKYVEKFPSIQSDTPSRKENPEK